MIHFRDSKVRQLLIYDGMNKSLPKPNVSIALCWLSAVMEQHFWSFCKHRDTVYHLLVKDA